MKERRSKLPPTQRRFVGGWDELDYLCKKIRYWWYRRQQKRAVDRYVGRLERVLRSLPNDDDGLAILRQEGEALLYEMEGEIDKAIMHRKREIELMERLLRESQLPRYDESTRAYMLQDRNTSDLQARREILQALLNAKSERVTASRS